MDITTLLINTANAAALGTTVPGIEVYVSLGYLLAGVVAAVVRFLILSAQPPSPLSERLRQSLLSLIVVSCLTPVAAAAGIPRDFALVVGLAFAAAGPEQVLRIARERIKQFLKIDNESDKEKNTRKDE